MDELDELDELLSDAVQDLTLTAKPLSLKPQVNLQQLSSEDVLTREKAEFAVIGKALEKTLIQKQFYATPRELSIKRSKPLPKTTELDDLQM
jgi:hypothetical protein